MINHSSDSTAIDSFEYTQILEVRFVNGSVYRYYGIPENVHKDFMSASSLGKFFVENIKERYAFERVK